MIIMIPQNYTFMDDTLDPTVSNGSWWRTQVVHLLGKMSINFLHFALEVTMESK